MTEFEKRPVLDKDGKPIVLASGEPLLYGAYYSDHDPDPDQDEIFKERTAVEELALYSGLDPDLIPEGLREAARAKEEAKKTGKTDKGTSP